MSGATLCSSLLGLGFSVTTLRVNTSKSVKNLDVEIRTPDSCVYSFKIYTILRLEVSYRTSLMGIHRNH